MLPAEEAWRISGEALFTRVRGMGILRSSCNPAFSEVHTLFFLESPLEKR
jgi:hypothetical protein